MPAIEEVDAVALRGDVDAGATMIMAARPMVLRGLVSDWPLMSAGSDRAALERYLAERATDAPMEAFVGSPEIAGKYYYTGDLKSFNFERRTWNLREAAAAIVAEADNPTQTIYCGSLPTGIYLPNFEAENPTPLSAIKGDARVWLGHASNVSCHYDTLDNVACVAVGERRFTLYPPQLVGDMYVGPIDRTLAGQPVSLAAAASSGERARFPRFEAVAHQALEVTLGPGDAIYIPKLWWHQVEGLAPVNLLINYWWDATGSGPDAPYTTMLLAMTAIAERPPNERDAWRALFENYVFRPKRHPLEHLPEEDHGLLGPLKENGGRIRAYVMKMLRGR